MKILVTGVGGQLGYDVCKVLDARKIENKGVGAKEVVIPHVNGRTRFNVKVVV